MGLERYLCVGGVEVANPNRTLAYFRNMGGNALSRTLPGAGCCDCPDWYERESEGENGGGVATEVLRTFGDWISAYEITGELTYDAEGPDGPEWQAVHGYRATSSAKPKVALAGTVWISATPPDLHGQIGQFPPFGGTPDPAWAEAELVTSAVTGDQGQEVTIRGTYDGTPAEHFWMAHCTLRETTVGYMPMTVVWEMDAGDPDAASYYGLWVPGYSTCDNTEAMTTSYQVFSGDPDQTGLVTGPSFTLNTTAQFNGCNPPFEVSGYFNETGPDGGELTLTVQSTNSYPADGGYARVTEWTAGEWTGLVPMNGNEFTTPVGAPTPGTPLEALTFPIEWGPENVALVSRIKFSNPGLAALGGEPLVSEVYVIVYPATGDTFGEELKVVQVLDAMESLDEDQGVNLLFGTDLGEPDPYYGPGPKSAWSAAALINFGADPDGPVVPFTTPAEDDAPWYDPAVPASADVLGVWIEEARLGTAFGRQVRPKLWGSSLGPVQRPGRELTIVGWCYTRSEAATAYARQWLFEALDGGGCNVGCDMPDAELYTHCNPEVPGEGARTLKRVGLTGWDPEIEPQFPRWAGFKFEAVLTAEVPDLITAPFQATDDLLLTTGNGGNANGGLVCLTCSPCPEPDPGPVVCGCMDVPVRSVAAPDVASCYCQPVQAWRTFVDVVPPRYWSDAVAIITVEAGNELLANLRIRGWVNPVGLDPLNYSSDNFPFECQEPCLDVEIGCVPARGRLVIDGATRRATLTAAGQSFSASGYLSSNGGHRFTWPEVSCHGLLLSIDADAGQTGPDATIKVEFVTRERG